MSPGLTWFQRVALAADPDDVPTEYRITAAEVRPMRIDRIVTACLGINPLVQFDGIDAEGRCCWVIRVNPATGRVSDAARADDDGMSPRPFAETPGNILDLAATLARPPQEPLVAPPAELSR